MAKRSLILAFVSAGILVLAFSVTDAHARHKASKRYIGPAVWGTYSSFCGYPGCPWGQERVYIPAIPPNVEPPCTRYFVWKDWWWRDTGFACERRDSRFDLFPDP
jgi:hypothetical protein